ncbi:hypothetical protein [Geothrix sp. PMB-07]|uniref:hypothetical protein n=1 Tax=Geothrix sp. PMB-07 TaxID=3068640 RepID=UPI002740640F|nr:hypothetical protein [Geothrix sp. PMB-07]WLT30873.1 hypothetical protein Q9293_14230 [Geothrix sp. PMB-07]
MMPARAHQYPLAEEQAAASRGLRNLLGLSRLEVVEIARPPKGMSISGATLYRAEGGGVGWVKHKTRLELAKLYEKLIKERMPEVIEQALPLLACLRRVDLIEHPHADHFRPEVELPSLISMTPIQTAEVLLQWWDTQPLRPKDFDTVYMEVRKAVTTSSTYYPFSSTELIDYGLRPATKIDVDLTDISIVWQTVNTIRAWAQSCFGPLPLCDPPRCLPIILDELYSHNIHLTMGLILAERDEQGPRNIQNIFRANHWLLVLAFGVKPIRLCQIWWQKQPKNLISILS